MTAQIRNVLETASQKPGNAWLLADEISGISSYMKSLLVFMFEQSDALSFANSEEERIGASGNLSTLLACTERYLDDIRALCAEAQKGGAQ
ncbi:hypothetical protein EGT07_18135 [Herbaspirillum sp. HC18]|nr:hypothetical protein EGT07_18135 [Herbaspirillum sp. HC18]